jgi:hypothetical protein
MNKKTLMNILVSLGYSEVDLADKTMNGLQSLLQTYAPILSQERDFLASRVTELEKENVRLQNDVNDLKMGLFAMNQLKQENEKLLFEVEYLKAQIEGTPSESTTPQLYKPHGHDAAWAKLAKAMDVPGENPRWGQMVIEANAAITSIRVRFPPDTYAKASAEAKIAMHRFLGRVGVLAGEKGLKHQHQRAGGWLAIQL